MAPPSDPLQTVSRALAAGIAASRAWRLLTVLLIVAVSYLALTPTPPPSIDFGWDKLNHALAFTALACSAYLGNPASSRARLLWLCALLAFAGLIEVLQSFLPDRSAQWSDMLGDTVGIVCGAVLGTFALRSAPWLSARSHWRQAAGDVGRGVRHILIELSHRDLRRRHIH